MGIYFLSIYWFQGLLLAFVNIKKQLLELSLICKDLKIREVEKMFAQQILLIKMWFDFRVELILFT